MVAWRAAGINYVRYSQLAAQVTRKCTKTEVSASGKDIKKVDAQATLKMNTWENGKMIKKD